MEEQVQADQLARSRRLATGLLILMTVIFVASHLFEVEVPSLSFVTAFAEAAMVGALADWFAVTALFRSPFGLPIPHTAIIPRNKDRIGEGLSNFLQYNFLTAQIIEEELAGIDFAGVATTWLRQPENSGTVSRQLVAGIPMLLRVMEDEDVHKFLYQRLTGAIDQINFAHVLSEIASVLVAGQHHQAFFSQLIVLADKALEKNQPYIRWKIHESSPRWLPKAIDDKLFSRLLDAIQNTLDEMKEDDSEWRMRFHLAVEEMIMQLKTSPVYEAKVDAAVREVLEHPLVRDYSLGIWHDIKMRLETDARAENSQMVARLNQAFVAIANDLLSDPGVQLRLNQWLRMVTAAAILKQRETIADLVARVIRKWDAQTISRKLELQVGKDLQYIRINGTLVGGVVGLGLHAVSRFL